jgi:uncharacterized membrane protein YdbT with pleckstrin-like domain
MDREPLYSAAAHWTVNLPGYVGLVFTAFLAIPAWVLNAWLGLFIGAAAFLGFIMLELVRRADRLVLYKEGMAREFKLLSVRSTFIEYEHMQDLELTQSFVDRILGVGVLHVHTAGTHEEIVFHGVEHPHELEAVLRAKMTAPSVDTATA